MPDAGTEPRAVRGVELGQVVQPRLYWTKAMVLALFEGRQIGPLRIEIREGDTVLMSTPMTGEMRAALIDQGLLLRVGASCA